jgi:hypothetical protein
MSATLPSGSVVTPAYGRDYKSIESASKDWLDGKDFQLQPQGVYCSIRDTVPGTQIQIRFAKRTKFVIVTTPAP